MGIFSSIMKKLGFGDDEATEVASAEMGGASTGVNVPDMEISENDTEAVNEIAVVDVVSHLEELSKNSNLNWKRSIVDLLKLLGLESSLSHRKELARELDCPEEKIGGDYSEMNIWLHKTVLAKIAQNGGNIPNDLYS
jgi:hypothetical protein